MPTFSSQEEVSTSSTDREQSVSSLGAAFQSSMLGSVRKVEMESTTGECDTTQEDLDCAPHEGGQRNIYCTDFFIFFFSSVVILNIYQYHGKISDPPYQSSKDEPLQS